MDAVGNCCDLKPYCELCFIDWACSPPLLLGLELIHASILRFEQSMGVHSLLLGNRIQDQKYLATKTKTS